MRDVFVGYMHNGATRSREAEDDDEFLWKSLRNCGVTSNDLEDLSGIDANEVELVIEAREWEGKKKVEIKYINRAGGAKLTIKKPLGQSELRKLSARMRATGARVPIVETPQKEASDPEASATPDDGSPF